MKNNTSIRFAFLKAIAALLLLNMTGITCFAQASVQPSSSTVPQQTPGVASEDPLLKIFRETADLGWGIFIKGGNSGLLSQENIDYFTMRLGKIEVEFNDFKMSPTYLKGMYRPDLFGSIQDQLRRIDIALGNAQKRIRFVVTPAF